jgi:predicted transcriptional regulator
MQTLSIELPDALNAQLLDAARARGASVAQLIREVLQDYLTQQTQVLPADSFAARAAWILDLPTDTGGPPDLSTNKAHMEGYGRD